MYIIKNPKYFEIYYITDYFCRFQYIFLKITLSN